MRGIRRLCVVAMLTAALVALGIVLRGPVRDAMARHWLSKLDSAPDEEVPGLLAQLAELGDAGIPALAAALGSEREIVARHARRQLVRLLEQWKHLGNRGRTPKLALLAEALAAEVESFGPAARSDAAHLATRILQWPLDPAVVDRADVIAACETVVRAARAQTVALTRQEQGLRATAPEEDIVSAVPTTDERRRGLEGTPDHSDTILRLAGLPGGRLPVQPAPGADEAPERVEPMAPTARTALSLRGPLQQPWPFAITPEPTLVQAEPLVAASVAPEPGASRGNKTPSAAANPPASAKPRRGSGDLSTVDDYELTRLLRADKQTALRAREELARRGWRDVHLELAGQLHDPDPAVRRRLARVLPLLESVEAVPWLLWLARDADAEVRLAAIGALATTGDPEILDRVLSIARTDADERVRRQAALIASQRDGTLR